MKGEEVEEVVKRALEKAEVVKRTLEKAEVVNAKITVKREAVAAAWEFEEATAVPQQEDIYYSVGKEQAEAPGRDGPLAMKREEAAVQGWDQLLGLPGSEHLELPGSGWAPGEVPGWEAGWGPVGRGEGLAWRGLRCPLWLQQQGGGSGPSPRHGLPALQAKPAPSEANHGAPAKGVLQLPRVWAPWTT
jgi:hypothetical protein